MRPSDPKEVDFFSYYFDRGYRWYESHFPHAARGVIGFDCSPSYFHDPRAPARAHDYDAGLRIVALLRDPVDRAFSNHTHEIVKGHIPAMPFEDGLANNPAYVEQGLYATHLGRWLDAFGSDGVLVLFAEDITRSPNASVERFYRFAGIDPTFRSALMTERRNVSDRARFPLLRRALRGTGDWMRRRGWEAQLVHLKANPLAANVLKANSVAIRAEIPPLSAETRARLTDRFAPEMDALRARLKLDRLPWDPA